MKRLQNRIAESRTALPWTVLLTAAVWTAVCALADDTTSAIGTGRYIIMALLTAVACWQTALLNTHYALMRTFSRMPACSLLVLTVCSLSVFGRETVEGLLTTCLMLGCYHHLFATFQDKQAIGHTFTAFALLSVAALFTPYVLLFVPLLWILLATSLMAFSPRSLVASLLGLALPCWLMLPLYLLRQPSLPERLIPPVSEQLIPLADISQWQPEEATTISFVALLFLLGTLNFLYTSHHESIKTRMLFRVFITTGILTLLLILVQPQRLSLLLPLLIAQTAPLIAHFITFTNSRLTNLMFIAMLTTAALLTALSLWKIS